jgi:DNA ligase (NAD+)
MKKSIVIKRINKLQLKIKKMNKLYYQRNNIDDNLITNFEYDKLKIKLKKILNKFNKGLKNKINIPVINNIGDDRQEEFKKYTYKNKMYSLKNCYDQKNINIFLKKNRKNFSKDIEYIIEPKIDGIAINLIYKNGILHKTITRGNGIQGDDISYNMQKLNIFPKKLIGSNFPTYIEIWGEICIKKKEYKKINLIRKNLNHKTYKNPRSLVVSTIRTLNLKKIQEDRKLDYIIYGIGKKFFNSIKNISSQEKFLKKIKKWGLNTIDFLKITGGKKNFLSKIKKVKNNKIKLSNQMISYATDGIVIKINSFNNQLKMGWTEIFPKWAIAYKFNSEKKTTVLNKINFQVSRNGLLTPIANFNPITLGGSKISKATLHNIQNIKKKNIYEGNLIIVEKTGNTIPSVIKIKDLNNINKKRYIKFPKFCPSCKTKLSFFKKKLAYQCLNSNCFDKKKYRILHFSSRNALNIKNLGIKTIEKLLKKKFIKSFEDLYFLKKNKELKNCLGGSKKLENLINEIKKSKNSPLNRIIYAIGIPNIGIKLSLDIAKKFNSFNKFSRSSKKKLLKIPGINLKICNSIINFFLDKKNLKVISKLKLKNII